MRGLYQGDHAVAEVPIEPIADKLDRARMQALGGWLCGAIACALTILYCLNDGSADNGLFILGLVLAATLLASTLIGGMSRPLGVVLALAWCATLGLWFRFWEAQAGAVLEHWWPRIGFDAEWLPMFVEPAAILGAGTVTGAVLYLPTRSMRIVGQAFLLSVMLAGTPLTPSYPDVAVGVGAALWVLGITGALYGRAIHRVLISAGEVCAHCRYDLDGLDGPSCPRCGEVVEARATLIVPGTLVPMKARDAA